MSPTVQRAAFADLGNRVLYDILRVRSEVFVVEQECVFLDLDDRDHEPTAEHLWTSDDAGVTATVRLLHEGAARWSIGRVVTRPDARGRGLAAIVMQAALDRLAELGATDVDLGAQAHLTEWYERFGFRTTGHPYIEDGIPHETMTRTLEPSAR